MVSNPVKARGQVSLVKLYDGTNGKDGKDGAQGVPGAPGADGKTTYVHVAYADSADGKTNFSTTDPTNRKYIGVLTDFNINDSTDCTLYTWSLAQGPVGPTGATGTPGAKGADGRTTYVHVAYSDSADGTTSFSTTDPTNRAYIGVLTDFNLNDSTTPSDYTWSLAKGADGAQGEQGIPGQKGADGRTTYVHFAYANSADGTNNFSVSDPNGRSYIGTYTDFNINDSTTPSDYTWSLAKGADGAQGIPGPVGPDGRTSYVHFAYATSADGSTGFSTTNPTGASYIGTYTDFTINDSTDYKSYTWSRMKGDTGNGIANTVIEYQITNTQDQPSDTSGWTTTIPNIGAGVYLWTRTTFIYTDGTKSRTYTVSRQSDNVYTAVLTNDSITLPADASGTVTDFSGANGSFLVYDGAYQVDSSTITVQVAQQVNVTVAVGGNNYSITSMDKTKDSGYFDLSYTYKGVLLTKRVSVSKSKRGTDGSNPVIVNLSATSQVLTFDSNNKPYPVNQNINFSTTVSGTSATPVYSAIPYDDNGVAGTAIVLGAYGTNGKQLQVAQIGNYQRVVVTVTAGGGTDSTTVVRVKDGSSVSPIPDPSNTVSSATPPTNPKEGDWWNDTSQTPNVLKYRYRDKWVQYELDGYYVKANSISGEAIVTNTLEAQKIKYTNSDGTTTNLQTFDLKGIQTAMTDSSGHTYTSMDNAVSSTQTWKSTNNKLDTLQVGGRNWLLESKTSKSATGNNTSNQGSFYYTLASGMTSGKMYTDWGAGSPFTVSFDWVVTGSTISGEFGPQLVSQPYGIGAPWISVSSTNTSGHYVYTSTSIASNWAGTSANSLTFRLEYLQGTVTISNIKLEQGTFATTYTEAPEDVASWTQAQIKVTADQINIGVSSAKSTADAVTNKVNNLQVGGRNLLLNSRDFAKTPDWTSGTEWYIRGNLSTDTYQGLSVIQTNGAWGGPKYRTTDLFSRGVVNTTDTYVLSAWMRNTGTAPVYVNYYAETATNSNTQVVVLPAGSDWVRVASPAFKFTNSNDSTIRFEPTWDITGGYLEQAGLKLEKGNMPTDWSPAPEDTDAVITKAQADIQANANAITQKVSQTDYNTKTGQIDGQISTINQTANTISQTVSNVKAQVDGLSVGGRNLFKDSRILSHTITPNGTTITVEPFDSTTNMWHIVGPAEEGWADGFYIYGYSSEVGLKEGDSWSFSADVKGTGEINIMGLETGTHLPQPVGTLTSDWKRMSQTGVSGSGVSLVMYFHTTATQGIDAYIKLPKLETGNMPTDWSPAPEDTQSGINSAQTSADTANTQLSSMALPNLFPNSDFDTDYGYRKKDGNTSLSLARKDNIDGRYNGTVQVISTDSTWQGYWARNIPVYGGQKYSMSVLVHYTNGGLSNGLALLDIWFVDKDGNRISRGDGGNRSDTTGQVGSPYWVKLYAEGVIAPTNASYVQVSLLVNNAGAGQTAMFTQPVVVASSKLLNYTPNDDIATTLKLTADNYTLGVTSDGNLISGITGNQQQVTLKGNMIKLDADTVIGNNFLINSANIANGAIGTAQIGDAAITSAKISSLDVNKITGNISNWVLSQWTNATGSKVTIDGNGLYFSPGTSRMTTNGFEAWRMDGGHYAAMGLVGSYAWESNSDINGMGLIAKYYDQPHTDPNDPYRNEAWGADTISIGALAPETGNGYNYVAPFMIFPANGGIGNMYFQGNNDDTIVMGRWMSIYTGLNMRGHSIVNSSGYSLKENFNPVSGTDALDIFDNTEIMTYDYKPDSEDIDGRTLANMQNKVGFVINDNGYSPFKTDPRLIRYGNTRDDSVTVGYLMAAVKELHTQVKELTAELEEIKGSSPLT